MENVKFKAFDKVHKDTKEVAVIDWINEIVLLWNKAGNVRMTIKRDFEQVELVELIEPDKIERGE